MMFAPRVGRWQLILTQFVEGVQTVFKLNSWPMMDYSIQKMLTTRVWKGKRKGGGGVVETLDHNIHVMLIQSRGGPT